MTEEVKNIEFMAAYMDENIVYAAGMGLNILFQFDIETKKIQRLGVFKGFKVPYAFKICKMFKYKEKMYCFSLYSYEVAVYNLDKNIFTYCSPDKENGSEVNIRCVCRVGNDVWLFQEPSVNSVIVFSMENEKYSKYIFDVSMLERNYSTFIVNSETCVYLEPIIWRCIPGSNMLLTYDVQTLKVKLVKLDVDISSYTINYVKDRFFILGSDGKKIVTWKQDTNDIRVWETGYKGIEQKPFREIVCKGEHIFLIPGLEDKIYYYNICEDGLNFMKQINYPLEFKRLHCVYNNGCQIQSMFMGYTYQNDELYLFPFGGNGMLCLNVDNLKMKFFPVQISEEDYVASSIESQFLLLDSQARLECLMEYVKYTIMNPDKIGKRKNLTGSRCWERLKSV